MTMAIPDAEFSVQQLNDTLHAVRSAFYGSKWCGHGMIRHGWSGAS